MHRRNIFNNHLFLALILVVLSHPSYAQICAKTNTPEVISPSNYEPNPNNSSELLDRTNPIIWQRCFYGQTWNDATQDCDGSPKKLTWQEALVAADTNNWRLPNIKELLDVIDFQCFAPPLHPDLFPSAPASLGSGIWTSSPLQTNLSLSQSATSAWLVDLGHGKLAHQKITALNFVLFIKPQ